MGKCHYKADCRKQFDVMSGSSLHLYFLCWCFTYILYHADCFTPKTKNKYFFHKICGQLTCRHTIEGPSEIRFTMCSRYKNKVIQINLSPKVNTTKDTGA